jgi:hypothetical protein
MKKTYFALALLAAVAVLSFSGCGEHDDINGDLDGFWQLRTITYNADGTSVDVQDSLRFMAVQLHLLQLRNNGRWGGYARFEHTGDSLFIAMIDSTTTKKTWMMNFGMDGVRQRFKVVTLNGKHLVLRSRFAQLTFHKF